MCDIATKVLANNNVPSRGKAFIKLLLDMCSDVLLDIILIERVHGDIDGLLLHFIGHIDVLDDGSRGVFVSCGWCR